MTPTDEFRCGTVQDGKQSSDQLGHLEQIQGIDVHDGPQIVQQIGRVALRSVSRQMSPFVFSSPRHHRLSGKQLKPLSRLDGLSSTGNE